MPEKAALITVLIVDRPLCLTCITTKSGLSIGEVESYLNIIKRMVDLRSGVDRCRACGEPTTVYSLARRD